MDKYVFKIQTMISMIGAWISAKFGILGPILIVLGIMMLLDYVSGMLASKQESIRHPNDKSYGWSSKKGVQGIIKKMGYLLVIAVAIVLDYIILYVASAMDIHVQTKAFFALMVAVWYVLNELLSIIENVGRMGASVPDWLRKYIAVLKETINKKTDQKQEDEMNDKRRMH